MGAGINLASRPFVNARPVARVTAALWALGLLLAAVAAWSFWSFAGGREDQRAELGRIETAIERERAAIAELSRELAGIRLDNQNERVRYLNQRIAERAFSWSLLFDRLAEILPADVRLVSLAPQVGFGEDGARRTGRAQARGGDDGGERVNLQVHAVARRPEAILELLDALFASPLFERPNLAQESREGAETSFTLSVVYLPEAAREAEARAAEAAGAVEVPAENGAAEPARPVEPPRPVEPAKRAAGAPETAAAAPIGGAAAAEVAGGPA